MKFDKKILILLYLFYVVFGWALFVLYYNAQGESIFKMSFHYGELIESIIKTGKYQGYYFVNTNDVYLTFSAHRLPLIPYFIVGISYLTSSTSVIVVGFVKNLIWQLPFTLGMFHFFNYPQVDKKYKLIFGGLILFFPQVIINSFALGMEEGYIIPILVGFFGVLFFKNRDEGFSKDLQLLGLLLISFWLKNTFMYILPVIIGVLFLFRRSYKFLAVGLVSYAFSVVVLMSFNLKNSGEFTLRYPFKYWNLYKGNNPKTFDYYPTYTLDAFDYIDPELQLGEVKDQWEFDDYYKEKYDSFINNYPSEAVWGYVKKFAVLFFDIRPNGKFTDDWSMAQVIGVFFMILIRVIQWLSVALGLYLLFSKNTKEVKLTIFLYLSFLAGYFLPYVLGWGTFRHISPLFAPVIFGFVYIFSCLPKLNLLKKSNNDF